MMIPVLIVRDVPEAIAFFTHLLDFALVVATPDDAPFHAVLRRGADEVQLNLAHGDRAAGGASFIVICDDIDARFAAFVDRGLAVPTRADSPVHAGPLDQSWGTREVYIDDPSRNTIIYQQR